MCIFIAEIGNIFYTLYILHCTAGVWWTHWRHCPVVVVASSKWMLHTGGGWGETPHMIVKRFGCTAIHNKVLYECTIQIFQNSYFGAWNTEISKNHDARIFVSIGTRPNSLIPPVTLCISPLLLLLNALSLSHRPGSLIEQHLLLPLWDY